MALKKGDFIEVEYTGKTKEEGFIFDTTDEAVAKKNNIFNEQYTYGPVIICLGENQVLKGIDMQLEGKEPGSHTVTISPEDGFGKKNAKLLRMIPLPAFKKQNIVPHPGLQINMDGVVGTVRTVTGGRTIVDFNHPLASKELEYEVKVNRIITDDKEKIQSYLKIVMNQKDIPVIMTGNAATVTLPFELSKENTEQLTTKLKELTCKEITFTAVTQKSQESQEPTAQPNVSQEIGQGTGSEAQAKKQFKQSAKKAELNK